MIQPTYMTSWHVFRKARHQLFLHLFLLLNATSAAFVLCFPVDSVRDTSPLLLILFSSLMLVCLQLLKILLINLNQASSFLGLLWALLMFNNAVGSINATFLIICLNSVLLNGVISFTNNIIPFVFYIMPVTLVVLWLGSVDDLLHVVKLVALPTIGIIIQNITQKQSEHFILRLMNKLIDERETLNDLSMLEPLTGLYNRRGFQKRLERIQACGTDKYYVLLIDIDNFKSFNDHYGHSMGDQALIRVSSAIQGAVRSRDIVTRFGGDEFMVLLSNIDSISALQTAERIRQSVFNLNIPHTFQNQVARNVTVSIGLAPFAGGNIESSLNLADKALYKAKNQGRNRISTSTCDDEQG